MPETVHPHPHPIHLLIVDDEPAIRTLVKRYFEKHGAIVYCAASGDEMHALLRAYPVDLVFLDVNLPGKDGFVLLDEINQCHTAAVIMLTVQNELNDRLHGLNGGADDYVPKPFDMSELRARAHAVLRRMGRLEKGEHPPMAALPDTARYGFAGYWLDSKVRELRMWVDSGVNEGDVSGGDAVQVELSPAEMDLLLVFVKHPQTVLSRGYLLQQTRGRDCTPFDRTVDVRVGQLRKKLPVANVLMPLFKTVRGGGYMLTVAVERIIDQT